MVACEKLLKDLIEAFPGIDAEKASGILRKYEIKGKVINLPNPDTESKIEQFLFSKKIEGVSRFTAASYKAQLKLFSRYIRKPIQDITAADIRSFLGHNQKLKMSTICTKYSVLKSFFGWAIRDGLIEKDPMAQIKVANKEKRLPKAMSMEELLLVRENCRDIRARAMVEFMYSTGCRLSEVSELNRDDIDFTNKTIRVIGKGNKERTVYLSTTAIHFLKKYLFTRLDDCEALFVTERQPCRRMKNRAIQCEIAKIGEKAGLKKSLHPHIFRHTMATHLLNNGAPLMLVQLLLGHSNPGTTQIYATMSESTCREQFYKYMAQ